MVPSGWVPSAFARNEIMPKNGPRVVVIGGGWGGATAAKYIRLQDPSIEVVMIERQPVFRSCPISNWVIGGLKEMSDITVGYDALKNKHGIKVLQDTVTEIDPGSGWSWWLKGPLATIVDNFAWYKSGL